MSNSKIAATVAQTARLLEYREGPSYVTRELADIATRVKTLEAPLALFSYIELDDEAQVAEFDEALKFWFGDFSRDGVWVLRETILTHTNPIRDDMLKANSAFAAELLSISALSVDAARFLRRALGVRSLIQLKRLCAAGALAQTGNFSESDERDIIEEIQRKENDARKSDDEWRVDEIEQIEPIFYERAPATDDPAAIFFPNANALADAVVELLAEPLRASIFKAATDLVSKDAINLAKDQALGALGKARRFFTSPSSPNYAKLRREEEERNRAQAERRAVQEAEIARENAVAQPFNVIKVGSLARGDEIIGALDFLIVTDQPEIAFERVQRSEFVKSVVARGERWIKTTLEPEFFEMPYNSRPTPTCELTFYAVSEWARGAMEIALTSTREHWQELQRRAQERGWNLTIFGLYDGAKRITSSQTRRVYEKLGLAEPPAVLRRSDLAWKWIDDGAPELIETRDLRADLHMHTTHSDGLGSIEEMVDFALDCGLSYIAITDHTQNVPGVTGLGDVEFLRLWELIDRENDALRQEGGTFRVLKGAEVDILEDGGLDLKDETMRRADWIVASIHVAREQSREMIERRYLDAFRSPYVDAIAHPTERVIGKEGPMKVDFEFLCENAKRYGKALELNSQPRRLDLPSDGLVMAKKYGVPIVISTDAHAPDQIEYLRFGVDHARRAGLTASDVLNAASCEEIIAWRNDRIRNATRVDN